MPDHTPQTVDLPASDPVLAAVVTGASSGIGRATAVALAKRGYNLMLTARREDELRRAAAECAEYGVRAIAQAADTGDEQAVQAVADSAVQHFGHFDVWVNAAAVGAYGKFLDIPSDDFERIVHTDLLGYVNGSRAALGHFRSRSHGLLIQVGSVNGVAPVPLSSPYVASKFAVRGFSQALRMELELEGLAGSIHVCHVMPPSVDTHFFQNAANYSGRELQAIEPVHAAAYVAKRIVSLIDNPKPELLIAPSAKLMAWYHGVMPRTYERAVSKFVNFNAFNNRPVKASQGSLYAPMAGRHGIDGGWRRTRLRADALHTALGVSAAIATVMAGSAALVIRRRRVRTST